MRDKRRLCPCAGFLDNAIRKYTQLLTSLQPGACSGLYACLLLRRAVALSQMRDFGAALQSVDFALEWEPESADCIQLRAEVWPSMVCNLFVYSSDTWFQQD